MPLALDAAAQDLLFREAHTARVFTDEPVTDEQIREIYDLIKFGPTAHNSSPLRITLIRTPEAKQRLLAHLMETNRPKTAGAPLAAILSVDLDFHEKLPELFPVRPDLKEDPAYADPDTRQRNGTLSAALQIGYFVLGVRAAGLAAGPMSGFDADGLNKEFFGDGRQQALVVVNIGHPAATAYSPRLPRLAFEDAARVL
ncbi:malonic semialdehyde reductase [Streptomyces litchfieldiae]|uniref:Malonic semialdehyde reductase n=1 Tax=Streptomyces litchfieldiae TaxID=3075543 RepID=A0ABU2MLJ1_9ACTN|nr:malonic semialdehyde reductase [Streptomyces sp. DSM 44938]MDT0342400.1 malonic semialdehyde reductase [Streptomyces sp. DSM 44938]